MALVTGVWLAGGCAAGGRSPSPSATEAEWRLLATPRAPAVPGAARVTLAGVEFAGPPPWSLTSPVPISLGVTELVAAGLLRRGDVRFVERRRFSAAADTERRGLPRPRGAPPAGTSEGAELIATVVWLPFPGRQSALVIRLADAATGAVLTTHRVRLEQDADPVGLARQSVGGILAALDEIDRLPSWNDPEEGTAPALDSESGVPANAVEAFLAGLAAEETWAWDRARESYQSAAGSVGFAEARVALARTARLRLGGTLGES